MNKSEMMERERKLPFSEKVARIIFDIDGTLNEWQQGASLKEVTAKGYFASRPEQVNMVQAVKNLLKNEDAGGYEVHFETACFADEHSADEKISWLKKRFSIDTDRIHICPMDESKANFIRLKVKDILVDDFTTNLKEADAYMLENYGVKANGVKVFNPVNVSTGTTWDGTVIWYNSRPEVIENQILALLSAS